MCSYTRHPSGIRDARNTRPQPCVSSYVRVALSSYLNARVCVRLCVHASTKASLSVPWSESAKRLVTWSIHYIRTIASSNRHAPSLWIWRARSVCACVVLFCVFQRVSRETPEHIRNRRCYQNRRNSTFGVRGNRQGRHWWPWESSPSSIAFSINSRRYSYSWNDVIFLYWRHITRIFM